MVKAQALIAWKAKDKMGKKQKDFSLNVGACESRLGERGTGKRLKNEHCGILQGSAKVKELLA